MQVFEKQKLGNSSLVGAGYKKDTVTYNSICTIAGFPLLTVIEKKPY